MALKMPIENAVIAIETITLNLDIFN